MNDKSPISKEFLHQNSTIISQTDIDGKIVYVNNKFCEISGYSREELLGKPHNIITHPDTPKKVFQILWKTIQDGQTYNGLLKNLRKDGLYYWIEIEILPLYHANQNISGYIALGRTPSRKDIEDYENQG